MRNRFYSPETTNSHKQADSKEQELKQSDDLVRLRQVASTNKIMSAKSVYSTQKKIGGYVYDVGKQLGRGYSSVVYKGVNIRTQMEVAIKVLDIRDFSASNMQMLENEAKVLRSLDHPHVIKCFDIYRSTSHCYIITEYCKNGDLQSFLRKHGKLQQVAAVSIINQIMEGTKYLIEKHIIHRDLKPANILKGDNGWKIADFGFSIFSEGKMKSKYNVGTPLYMPLEALIQNVYSPGSDIFSVGIIFYELLTGTTPWECRLEKELISKMKTEPYMFPTTVKISKGVTKILEKMCAIAYDDRISREDFLSLNLSGLGQKMEFSQAGSQVQGEDKKDSAKEDKKEIKTNEKKELKIVEKNVTKTEKKEAKVEENVEKKISGLEKKVVKVVLKQPKKEEKMEKMEKVELRKQMESAIEKQEQKGEEKKEESNEKIMKSKSALNLVIKHSFQPLIDPVTEARNNQILINQLHYCRFLYYFIRNMKYLQVSPKNKIKLNIVLYRHLNKLVVLLSEKINNYFHLQKWSSFKDSKKYQSTYSTMQEYSARYRKEFEDYIKEIDPAILQQVDKTVSNMGVGTKFSEDCYSQLLRYISSLIREANHNLTVHAKDLKQPIPSELKGNIQALGSLFKYFKLVELSLKHYQKFDVFEKESNIRVQIDYAISPTSLERYTELRELLKFI